MKIKFPILSILISGLLFSADVVKYGGEIFEFSKDARLNAMGQSGVSFANGPSAIFVNPANLNMNSANTMFLSHQDLFSGLVKINLLAKSFHLKSENTLSFGFIRRVVEDIPNTANAVSNFVSDIPIDYSQITYFDHQEIGFITSYSGEFYQNHTIGLNFKTIYNFIDSYSAYGFGLDVGYKRDLSPKLSFGVFLQDITTTVIKWNTGTTEIIPPRIVFGKHYSNRSLIISADIGARLFGEYSNDGVNLLWHSIEYHFGCEYTLFELISLRGGSSSLYQYSLGFGLKHNLLDFDYAYISAPLETPFNASHQISIGLHL